MSTTQAPSYSDVSNNPYVAGKALGDEFGFVGRQDVLQLVETELSFPTRSVVILHGQRRIGKTSILLQLARRLPKHRFQPIYFDLMAFSEKPLGKLLAEIALEAARQFGPSLVDTDQFDDDGRYFQQEFLPSLYKALSRTRRPVFLFDEFDVLDHKEEDRLAPYSANKAFLSYLARLMTQEPRLGFVFVVGRKLEDLSIKFKATFKNGACYQRVSVLDVPSARALILTAEREGTLHFAEDAVDCILGWTSGHPFFTQLLCQRLWDVAHSQHPGQTPTITKASVDGIVPSAIERGLHIFEWIWDALPAAERIIFAATAEVIGDKKQVSRDDLIDILLRYRIYMIDRDVDLASETLVEWELLRQIDGGYGFFVEMLRRWIAHYKPLSKVKEELEAVDRQASHWYESGRLSYQQGDLDEAELFFRRALNRNTNHFKARLQVAQVLSDLGRHRESVLELEEAYKYDESAAVGELIRSLLQHGQALEQRSDIDGALRCYERLLQLAPKHPVARQRRAALWKAQADTAFAAKDLLKARDIYQKADQFDNVAEIDAILLKYRTAELENNALEFERHEAWGEAAKLYEQIAGIDNSQSWSEKLVRCQQEGEFHHLYAEALNAYHRQDTVKALSMFAHILSMRSDYKDVALLTARAADRLARGFGQSDIQKIEEHLSLARAETEKLNTNVEMLNKTLSENREQLRRADQELNKERQEHDSTRNQRAIAESKRLEILKNADQIAQEVSKERSAREAEKHTFERISLGTRLEISLLEARTRKLRVRLWMIGIIASLLCTGLTLFTLKFTMSNSSPVRVALDAAAPSNPTLDMGRLPLPTATQPTKAAPDAGSGGTKRTDREPLPPDLAKPTIPPI